MSCPILAGECASAESGAPTFSFHRVLGAVAMLRRFLQTSLFVALVAVSTAASACPLAGIHIGGLNLSLFGTGCGSYGYPGYGYPASGYGGAYGTPGGGCNPCAIQTGYAAPMMSARPWMYQQAMSTNTATVAAPSVQYQQQACVERVPVTTYQTVNRMVYVPQVISQQIPQTTYQQRLSYRTIAMPSPQTAALMPQTFSATPTFTAGIQTGAMTQPSLYSLFPQTATGLNIPTGMNLGMAQNYSYAPGSEYGEIPTMTEQYDPVYGMDAMQYESHAMAGSQPAPTPDPNFIQRAPVNDPAGNGNQAAAPTGTNAQQMSYTRTRRLTQPARQPGLFSPVPPRSAMWQSRYTTR